MDVAESIADEVVLVNRGEIIAQGGMSQLQDNIGKKEAGLETIFLELTKDMEKDKLMQEDPIRDLAA